MREAANITARERTNRSGYAFWTWDTVRFSHIDRYRNINNVAVATYCETGRVEFAEKLWPGSTAGEGTGWVIAKLTVTFLAQAHYPGDVEIGTRVERVSRTSCIFGQGLFKDGECFATAEAVLVWLDLADGGRPVLPSRRPSASVCKKTRRARNSPPRSGRYTRSAGHG